VDKALWKYGLCAITGQISTTGIGGLATGGGFGLLTHRYGWMVDNILAAEIVLASGKIVMASTRENPDLFSTILVGARHLGVVTRFKFRAFNLPSSVISNGIYFWDITNDSNIVKKGLAALRKMSQITAFVVVATPPVFGGKTVLGIHLVTFGNLELAKTKLNFLKKEIGHSPLDEASLAERTWPEVNSAIDFLAPYPSYWYTKSFDMLDNENVISKVVDTFVAGKPGNIGYAFDYMSGAGLSNSSRAFGRNENYYMNVMFAFLPTDSKEAEGAIAEARKYFQTTSEKAKDVILPSSYSNFDERAISNAPESLKKLKETKANLDPNNFFESL